jgi:tripartite-type tricarboxylate transporter receptor subunit TctC
MHPTRRTLMAGSAALALPMAARAQSATRIVVPFPPGGPTDFAARLIGDAMAPVLGRSIVVENRPGGAGNIAAQQVVNATADGTTILFSGSGLSINAALMRDIPFDARRDLAPVVLVSASPNLLTAGQRFAGATVADLLAEAQRRPGALNLGVGSLGTSQHMAAELLKVMGSVDITVVPYRGAAPAMNDLIGGTLDLLLDGITSSLPQVRSGRIRALGVTSPGRSAAAPEIPAVAETLPGFEAAAWFGLFCPRGTPAERIAELNRAANVALSSETVRTRFAESGAAVLGGTPEVATAHLAAELERWADVVRRTGARLE